jgi:hypothetical protein
MQEKKCTKTKIFGGELSFRTVERGQGGLAASGGHSLQASAVGQFPVSLLARGDPRTNPWGLESRVYFHCLPRRCLHVEGGNLPHLTQRRRTEEVTDVEKCADSSLYPSVEHHPREEILRGGHWPQAQGRVGGRCSLRMRRCGRFHVSDTQRVLLPASEFTVGLAYWFYDAESHGTPAAGRNKPIASRKDPSMEGGPSPPNWAHSGFSGPRLTPMRRKVVMLAHSMNLSPRKRRKMRQHEMPYARTTPTAATTVLKVLVSISGRRAYHYRPPQKCGESSTAPGIVGNWKVGG